MLFPTASLRSLSSKVCPVVQVFFSISAQTLAPFSSLRQSMFFSPSQLWQLGKFPSFSSLFSFRECFFCVSGRTFFPLPKFSRLLKPSPSPPSFFFYTRCTPPSRNLKSSPSWKFFKNFNPPPQFFSPLSWPTSPFFFLSPLSFPEPAPPPLSSAENFFLFQRHPDFFFCTPSVQCFSFRSVFWIRGPCETPLKLHPYAPSSFSPFLLFSLRLFLGPFFFSGESSFFPKSSLFALFFPPLFFRRTLDLKSSPVYFLCRTPFFPFPFF